MDAGRPLAQLREVLPGELVADVVEDLEPPAGHSRPLRTPAEEGRALLQVTAPPVVVPLQVAPPHEEVDGVPFEDLRPLEARPVEASVDEVEAAEGSEGGLVEDG